MRYDEGTATVRLGASELAGAIAALEVARGPLSPGFLGEAREEDVRAFEAALLSLTDEGRELLDAGLEVVANPYRTLRLASALGETAMHRATYAWGPAGVFVLAEQPGGYSLGPASADELTAAMLGPLLAPGELAAADLRLEVDGRAAIALVAAGDALRFGRFAALAAHRPEPRSVAAADVAARVRQATVEDPRWTLNLLASVTPFDAAAFMDAPTVDLAMARLAAARVFDVIEADGGYPALYSPTDDGSLLLDTLAYGSGRVAATVFEARGGGTVSYESLLLVRGDLAVLALDVGPEGGGLTAVSTAALTGLVARLAAPEALARG